MFILSLQKNKGFTVLELLLALTVIGIAVTIVTLSFANINSSQALDKSVVSVLSVLDEARSLTLSSVDASQYGVRLEDGAVISFKGSSFLPGSPDNATTSLHALVGIRNISLSGGGTSIVFNRLTGATSQAGTFELYLREATTSYKIITVTSTGLAEAN